MKINLNVLILYNDIRKNPIICNAIKLFNMVNEETSLLQMEDEYFRIQRELLWETEEEDMQGTYWQNYLCKLIAESENQFSMMAEQSLMDFKIKKLAEREFMVLKKLYHFDWNEISSNFQDKETCVCSMNASPIVTPLRNKRRKIAKALQEEDDMRSVEILYDYYKKYGCGIYERYEAFVWDDGLVGIKNYDQITFDQLVGYEKQKEQLIENTEFFLEGNKANNVLLYGDRGTGKSSSVKALLNQLKDQKLKIVSINKNHVKDLYKIMESVTNRGCKFIIFIDDLSFEENEVEYKYFKSVIEGGIEGLPSNVLIYVTSNRRNIIRETWKDRSSEVGDVHHNDGIQERMSLADRFGLTITFTSPDKFAYIEIVKELAKQEELNIEEELLISEALTWELRHNGRSGRVAKQFIYHMKAKKEKENRLKS